MAQSLRVKEFIEEVCSQVESKKAHGFLTGELIAHIEDQKLAYISEGMDENSAEERAIFQMGDPAAVGENLNQIHRPKREWLGPVVNIAMWLIAGGIFLAGIIFGIGIGYAIILANTGRFIGIIVGAAIPAFGFMLALAFISMYKIISNMIYGYSLVRDYRRRKRRGEIYAKKC
jgi:hypothetical protein